MRGPIPEGDRASHNVVVKLARGDGQHRGQCKGIGAGPIFSVAGGVSNRAGRRMVEGQGWCKPQLDIGSGASLITRVTTVANDMNLCLAW